MKKIETKLIITSFILLLIFIVYLLSSQYILNYINNNSQLLNIREGKIVEFSDKTLMQLNEKYKENTEYFFCLIGKEENNKIIITDIIQPKITRSERQVLFEQDPPCQIQGSIGSIHSHPKYQFIAFTCIPSRDDIYTWGEMKEPEPLINIIQCGNNKFYIFESPEKTKPANWISLKWQIFK